MYDRLDGRVCATCAYCIDNGGLTAFCDARGELLEPDKLKLMGCDQYANVRVRKGRF